MSRNHYYCDACDGTWLAEGELTAEADCPFCQARDVFPYKSDNHVAGLDAPSMARRLAAVLRQTVRPAPARTSAAPAKTRRMAS